MISVGPPQRGTAAVPDLVPAPVRLGRDAAALRAEVRGFLAAQRRAGTFEPRCDSWLAGWDEGFSRRLGAPRSGRRRTSRSSGPARAGWRAATRLWAWRDEAGNEAEWAELGERALAAGADGIWPLLADAD